MRTFVRQVVLCAVASAAMACGRPATEDQPVTSRSASGQTTAPSAATVEDRDQALVRLVHAIPAAAAVGVFTDEAEAFADVAYRAVMP